MKIVIAPDSFKESLSAIEAANVMEGAIKRVIPKSDIIKIPLADGGEGTTDVIVYSQNGERVVHEVTGPLGGKVAAYYGVIDGDTAVIEMAVAAGLDLIEPSERNPLKTTTYGVGELIVHALDQGVRTFYIGLGGSVTNDGGIGMAQALGAEILNEQMEQVAFGAEGLLDVTSISLREMDPRIKESMFYMATDVNNPLVGAEGATYIFGPQKGVTRAQLPILDHAMMHYGLLLEKVTGKSMIHKEGAGAAGGVGAACMAFLQADVRQGIDVVSTLTNLEMAIQDAHIVFTGEGKIDDQTMYGKTPVGVAKIAKRYGVPLFVLTGANEVTDDRIYETGITAIFPIVDRPLSLADAMDQTEILLEKVTENICRTLINVKAF